MRYFFALFIALGSFLCFLKGELYYITNPTVRNLIVNKLKECKFDQSYDVNDIYNWYKAKTRELKFFDEQKIREDCKDISKAFSSFNFCCCAKKGDYERKVWLSAKLLFDENLKLKESCYDNIIDLFPRVFSFFDFCVTSGSYLKQLNGIVFEACREKNFFIVCKNFRINPNISKSPTKISKSQSTSFFKDNFLSSLNEGQIKEKINELASCEASFSDEEVSEIEPIILDYVNSSENKDPLFEEIRENGLFVPDFSKLKTQCTIL